LRVAALKGVKLRKFFFAFSAWAGFQGDNMKFLSILLLSFLVLTGCIYEREETAYHVYYHSDGSTGGNPPADSKGYGHGEMVTILGKGSLVKDDYTFLGWRYNYYFYYAGDNITVQWDDINLYPVWDDGSNTPFSYKIENGEAIITRYNEENASSIVIPDTLQSKPVTAIDDNVFSNSRISSISLPKHLKSIGVGAFASNSITHLIIPDTVESIGMGAFRNNTLTKVTFGNSLRTIEPYAFGNNHLKDITIPENITSIGTGTFHENDIDMIKIGAGVEIRNDTSLGTYGMSFRAYYNQEKRAGLYLYVGDDTWERY